jgi:ribonuclease G
LPLPFFRRSPKSHESAPLAAAAPTELEHDVTPVVEAPEPASTDDGQSSTEASESTETTGTAPRKRRRGSRGGRGRKRKPGTAGAESASDDSDDSDDSEADADAEAAERPADAATSDRPARSSRGRGGRSGGEAKEEGGSSSRSRDDSRSSRGRQRRSAPRRAPLPKAKRELLISVDAGEKRVAVLEDDIVAEVYLERPEHRSIAGNIYLGIVDNVLPGMEAAFVEIGLEKNGFLYVDEIVGPELEGRKGARKITDLIQKGQTILVQAVKDPMKTKGARLTTEISLPGRFVVFVPQGEGLGVSRRLEDDERSRLKSILKEIAPKDGGVIVRTAAEGASADDIALDLDFLMRLWSSIEAKAKASNAPALIYQEAELPLRVTRDLFTGDFERLIVDHDRTHKRIVGYLKKTSPHMVDRVVRWKERETLMNHFGVDGEIRSTLNRRVDLPSGGYLIFDYAEAFTVIDVNTGRFVGSRSKKAAGPGRLEDTITKNNLEAVKEVVRQLRLRDIGGIIVIDFIDMANPKNRAQVEDALRQELERDRTKTYVVEISPLGLVEMTRQNVTDGPREVMTRKCPTCDGDGIIVSETTTAVEIERKLRQLVTPGSRAKAFKVEVSGRIASMLTGPAASRLIELEESTKRRFFLVGLEDVHLDHFRVLDQGNVERLVPAAPVTVGEEIELKLGELGLHDVSAGVGKVKGFDVVVADAAKLVGKKVTVKVAAVGFEAAYAELADAISAADQPLTAEAEAEKPTRAVRKPARAAVAAAAPVEDAEGEAEVASDDGDEAEAVAKPAPRSRSRSRRPAATTASTEGDAAATSDGEGDEAPAAGPTRPPRQRTRKPAGTASTTGAAEAADGDADAEGEEGDAAEAATPELGPDGLPKKKRTRRGSRGGRNRRKRPAVAADGTPIEGATDEAAAAEGGDADGDETTDAVAVEAAPAEKGDGPVIHVPGRDLDADGEAADGAAPARKRTRRGSRGGRNRKRPGTGAAVNGADSTDGDASEGTDGGDAGVAENPVVEPIKDAPKPPARKPAPATEPSPETTDFTYTPMSEWGNLD